MSATTRPLAEVVGENCKALRARLGLTQDELAYWARQAGLRWRASSVGDFEAGRSAPTFATVLAVATALQLSVDRGWGYMRDRRPEDRIVLGDLVDFEGDVSVTDVLTVPGPVLRNWVSGAVVNATDPDSYSPLDGAIDVADLFRQELREAEQGPARSGLAEQRLAKEFGANVETVAAAALRLWGKSFTEERDQRAGPDANRQKRGQVTRAMRVELAAALESGA